MKDKKRKKVFREKKKGKKKQTSRQERKLETVNENGRLSFGNR